MDFSRVPIIVVDEVEDFSFWFPLLRKEGYSQFEVEITPDARWLILGVQFAHLKEKPSKKT